MMNYYKQLESEIGATHHALPVDEKGYIEADADDIWLKPIPEITEEILPSADEIHKMLNDIGIINPTHTYTGGSDEIHKDVQQRIFLLRRQLAVAIIKLMEDK